MQTIDPETRGHRLAVQIVSFEPLEALGQRDFVRIKGTSRCSDEELREARQLITPFDPKPGRRYGAADTRYVTADVVVRKVRGRWQASLNRDVLPKLRVNQHYAQLLWPNANRRRQEPLAGIQEARWFVKNIQQRFETIVRVSQAIVDLAAFFDHGEGCHEA